MHPDIYYSDPLYYNENDIDNIKKFILNSDRYTIHGITTVKWPEKLENSINNVKHPSGMNRRDKMRCT